MTSGVIAMAPATARLATPPPVRAPRAASETGLTHRADTEPVTATHGGGTVRSALVGREPQLQVLHDVVARSVHEARRREAMLAKRFGEGDARCVQRGDRLEAASIRQPSADVARAARPVHARIEAGEERRHGGQRPRRRADGVREPRGARRERVQPGRRRAQPIAVASEPIGAQRVHHHEDERLRRFGHAAASRRNRERQRHGRGLDRGDRARTAHRAQVGRGVGRCQKARR
jgi:hypothetical protein